MIDYLRESLGLVAEEHAWSGADSLPRFLQSKRKYSVLSINNTHLLMIHVKEENFNVQSYLKQIGKLKAYWPEEMVLVFDKLSAYQRKVLIEQRLQFIIPGVQAYIPLLGILLQEQQVSKTTSPKEKFSAGAQVVFLYMLYHSELFPMTKTELARYIASNAMTITRAIQELQQLSICHCRKAGRSDYVSPTLTGKELWLKGKPYLISPVKKKAFVRSNDEVHVYPVSGEEALANVSMLAKPAISVRAIDRKMFKTADCFTQVNPAWEVNNDYIQLEIWVYDPCLLAQNGQVDAVSLYASLKKIPDERIEEALENMMEAHKW